GRLDRIGQNQDSPMHIPAVADHAAGRWVHILHDGRDIFTRPNPAAQPLLEQPRDAIEQALLSGDGLAELISLLASERDALLAQLEAGRDRLLEWHSCHPPRDRKS